MFEVTVEVEFCAAHALRIAGRLEPTHGHNWVVTATLAGASLDADGLLCDFHALERALREATNRFHNADLNALPPFAAGINPTAENVARVIAERLGASYTPPPGVRIASVSVTEAPRCRATYRPASGGAA